MGWKSGLTRTLESSKGKCKVLHLENITQECSIGWYLLGWEQLCCRGPGGPGGQEAPSERTVCCYCKESHQDARLHQEGH